MPRTPRTRLAVAALPLLALLAVVTADAGDAAGRAPRLAVARAAAPGGARAAAAADPAGAGHAAARVPLDRGCKPRPPVQLAVTGVDVGPAGELRCSFEVEALHAFEALEWRLERAGGAPVVGPAATTARTEVRGALSPQRGQRQRHELRVQLAGAPDARAAGATVDWSTAAHPADDLFLVVRGTFATSAGPETIESRQALRPAAQVAVAPLRVLSAVTTSARPTEVREVPAVHRAGAERTGR